MLSLPCSALSIYRLRNWAQWYWVFNIESVCFYSLAWSWDWGISSGKKREIQGSESWMPNWGTRFWCETKQGGSWRDMDTGVGKTLLQARPELWNPANSMAFRGSSPNLPWPLDSGSGWSTWKGRTDDLAEAESVVLWFIGFTGEEEKRAGKGFCWCGLQVNVSSCR